MDVGARQHLVRSRFAACHRHACKRPCGRLELQGIMRSASVQFDDLLTPLVVLCQYRPGDAQTTPISRQEPRDAIGRTPCSRHSSCSRVSIVSFSYCLVIMIRLFGSLTSRPPSCWSRLAAQQTYRDQPSRVDAAPTRICLDGIGRASRGTCCGPGCHGCPLYSTLTCMVGRI